jgi:hypothetical protein
LGREVLLMALGKEEEETIWRKEEEEGTIGEEGRWSPNDNPRGRGRNCLKEVE